MERFMDLTNSRLPLFLAAAATAILGFQPTYAETQLATPTGVAVLTVTGNITSTNMGDAAVFDLEMLQAYPSQTFETTTIWTEGVQSFTGVSLTEFLASLGVESGTIHASAINDYTIEIPVEDDSTDSAIVAYFNNGETMSVRDKGPLWIIYPFDSRRELRAEVVYSRSIWQLDRIEITD